MGIDTARINEILTLRLDVECECGFRFIITEREGGSICPGCDKDIDVGVLIKGRKWKMLTKCQFTIGDEVLK